MHPTLTGTNAAYLEQLPRIAKFRGPDAIGTHMIVNSEWGGFSAPSLPRLAADDVVDANSCNRGAQTFEKMISGLYLGRITVLTLLAADAEAAAPVLDAEARALLARPDVFPTPLVAAVDMDRRACIAASMDGACSAATDTAISYARSSEDLGAATAALQKTLGLALPPPAVALVKQICHLVTRRAARLSAAGVVAVLTHMGAAHPPSSDAATVPTVAVDGGAYVSCASRLLAHD